MNARKIVVGFAAGAAVMAAVPAFAHDDHGWRARPYHPHYYYRAPAYVYYPARPVVVAPAPVYYAPPPAPVYYRPAPVVYGQIPVGHHASIGFSLPLY